jgi:hypothetical protein
VHHNAQPLELFQVPVDGREVDVWRLLLDLRCEVIHGSVTLRLKERSQQKAPRRGNPASVTAHQFENVLERVGFSRLRRLGRGTPGHAS